MQPSPTRREHLAGAGCRPARLRCCCNHQQKNKGKKGRVAVASVCVCPQVSSPSPPPPRRRGREVPGVREGVPSRGPAAGRVGRASLSPQAGSAAHARREVRLERSLLPPRVVRRRAQSGGGRGRAPRGWACHSGGWGGGRFSPRPPRPGPRLPGRQRRRWPERGSPCWELRD